MYVCLCTGTTDRQIRQAVERGARSLDALRRDYGVGGQCGECSELAQEILAERLEELEGTPLFHAAV